MANIFDEIQEEIQRDDFLSVVRQWIPYAASFIILILIATGGYLLYANHMENKLMYDEDLYDEAMLCIKSKDYKQAKEIFTKMQKESTSGYQFLSSLQLSHLLQMESEIVVNNDSIKQIHTIYGDICQKYGLQFKNFFLGATDFSNISLSVNNPKVLKEIKNNFFSPHNAWQWYGAISNILWTINSNNNDIKYIKSNLDLLAKNSNNSNLWIAEMLSIGLNIPFLDDLNNNFLDMEDE